MASAESRPEASQDTIFVSIPCYRDSECQWTVKDLLEKAARPLAVSVGICFQYDKDQDAHLFENLPKELYPNQLRSIHIPHTEAKGPCIARHLAQSLYKGETYHLAIDSHMRFIKNWDIVLIEMLAKCPSKKPILTTYPPGYELPNKISTEYRPIVTCAKEFGSDGMLRVVGKLLAQRPPAPVRSYFWVAGFSFSRATVLEEVPYDPHLPFLFFGEESSMTVRLFCAGWDFFAPTRNIIYHLWERSNRPNFRENKDPKREEELSRVRVKFILGEVDQKDCPAESLLEIDRFGPNASSPSSLADYERESGVSFKSKSIEEKAMLGGLSKEMFYEDLFSKVLDLVNAAKPDADK